MQNQKFASSDGNSTAHSAFANTMPGDGMNEMEQSGDRLTDEMPDDGMNSPEATATGRILVLFEEGATDAGIQLLRATAGLNVSVAGNSDLFSGQTQASALVYPKLDVAVINANSRQLSSISSANAALGSPILTMEQEQIVRVEPIAAIQEANDAATWGLEKTNVLDSQLSGEGIKVAILDTGLNLTHPDFRQRTIISQSFIEGETVQDGHGHGTHCAGTACGPRRPTQTDRRYGVAYDADLYIGKVLNSRGSGTDSSILAGINWAVEQGCQVISMSIGGLVSVGERFSQIYEIVAQRALSRGILIVAAAGNDSRRNWTNHAIINPVSRPANSPSILAVAALDASLAIASFSNGGLNGEGGEVNIAGPGVNVFSSWIASKTYNTISGTSMATPHVAGIAALYAQKDSTLRGKALWTVLQENARPLPQLSDRDVGTGLIQAPSL